MLFTPEFGDMYHFHSSTVEVTETSIEFTLSKDAYHVWDKKQNILSIKDTRGTSSQEPILLTKGSRIKINHEGKPNKCFPVPSELVVLYQTATDINIDYNFVYELYASPLRSAGLYTLDGKVLYHGQRNYLYDTSFEYIFQ